jgi:hypothetical protein
MNKILYFLIPIGMAWALLSNSGGAAAVQNVDRTSSPLGVGSCGSCHGGGNYSPVISAELLDNNTVVNKYSPGKQYQVRVTIVAGNNPRGYGFQLVSLSGNNNVQGGSFGTAPAGFNKVTLDNRVYVEQSSTRSSGTFVIPWTAPSVGTGNIRFYSAGVAVNNSGGSGGDSHVQAALPVTIAEDLATLTVSNASINFSASGGSQNVDITSNTSWTATESLTYLSVSPTSGTNNGTVTIKCDPNTSTVARTGSITISGIGAASKTINFTQAGLAPVLNVTPSALTFQDTGGTQQISIESNMTWTLSESLTFVSLSATSGSNNRIIDVICQPNTSASKRTGTMTLSGPGVPTKTISISQNAAVPSLSVSPKELSYDQSGGNKTLSITSNTSWSVIESLSYVSVSQTTGANNANITVTCQSNSSSVSRSGVIKLASPGLDTQVINISQTGATTLLNVTPASMTFNSSGGTQKGLITSNTSWEVQENLSFIRVDSLSGINNGGINITCDSNFSAVTRTGVITLLGKGAVSKTINISQTGVAGFMNISPASLDFIAAGGKQFFLVNSNTNWTVTEALTHISLNKTTGSFTDTIWVTCTPNTTTISRSGLITISGVGVQNKTLTVNQLGELPRLSVNPTNLSFTSTAGTKTITITSNIPWTISDSAAYLSSNVAIGSNNATLTITCNANTSALSRNTVLYIAGTGVSTISIPVTQSGATATMTLSPLSLLFPSTGGEKSFNITSNTSWNILDTFPNLRFIPESGLNNGTVKVVCDSNTATSLRSFSIPVAGFGLTARTITVSQSGADEIFNASPNILNFTSAGGEKTFNIFSNTSWALSESSSFISINPSFGDLNKGITVLCDPNISAVTRKGKITFTGKSDASISIDIVQTGVAPLFKVLSDSIILDSSATQSSVKIESNTQWSLTKDADWISINTFSGSGNYNVLLSVAENPVMQERIGRLQIKSIQADSVKTVLVRQKGRKLQLPSNWQVKPTNLVHTIILPANLLTSIDGQPLSIGDFIGVFYKQQDKEMMAGYGAWTGSSTNFKVFGDDLLTTNVKEGLSVGEPFVIKIWSVKLKKEIMVRADFATIGTQGLVISTDKFTNGGISMISKITGTSTTLLTLIDENKVKVFPNPSNQFVQIQSNIEFLGQTFLEIYNAKGERIQQQNFPDGWSVGKNITLDFSEHPQGIYQLRWYNDQFYWHGKVAIIR